MNGLLLGLSLVLYFSVFDVPCLGEEAPKASPALTDQELEDFLKTRAPQKAAEIMENYDAQGTRLYWIKALGESKDKQALPLLLKGLNDHRPEVRLWAALALQELGEKAAIKPLMEKLSDTATVECYGYCPSTSGPNIKLGVRRNVCVCDAVIEALNGLIPGRKPEGRLEIFYPRETLKKTMAFQFFGANLPETPDTGHWGDSSRRSKAVEELRQWWKENKDSY